MDRLEETFASFIDALAKHINLDSASSEWSYSIRRIISSLLEAAVLLRHPQLLQILFNANPRVFLSVLPVDSYTTIAHNPGLSTAAEAITKAAAATPELMHYISPSARAALAISRHCDPGFLMYLARHASGRVFGSALHNPSMPPEGVQKAYHRLMARRPPINPGDKPERWLLVIAVHPNCPQDVLTSLLLHDDPVVRGTAAQRLVVEDRRNNAGGCPVA